MIGDHDTDDELHSGAIPRRETATAEAPVAILVGKDAKGDAKPFPLARPRVTIGRAPTCDLVVQDARVSRLHATIELVGERHVLADNGSSNGTFLNGLRASDVHSFVLREGDVIEVGAERLVYSSLASAAPEVPAALASATTSTFAVRDLLQDGFTALGADSARELQVAIQQTFLSNPRPVALDESAEIVAQKLGVHSVALFMEDATRNLRLVAARPTIEAASGLTDIARRAWASREGRLELGLPEIRGASLTETCIEARPSVAAVPLLGESKLAGVIAAERTSGRPLCRSDLALLAVLGQRVALTHSLQGAHADDTRPGFAAPESEPPKTA